MTLPTGRNLSRSNSIAHQAAFTLIELILVMALLMIVLAVSAPSLKNFFKGRNLDSEARRFLALTVYGQSRAVSEGIPMVLWIDAKERSYGLRAASGYLDLDTNAVEYNLDPSLQIETTLPVLTNPVPLNAVDRSLGNRPAIQFLPTGFIGETSPPRVLLEQDDRDIIAVTENTNRLRYELQAINSR